MLLNDFLLLNHIKRMYWKQIGEDYTLKGWLKVHSNHIAPYRGHLCHRVFYKNSEMWEDLHIL